MNDDYLIKRTGTKPNKEKQELNGNIHVTHDLLVLWMQAYRCVRLEAALRRMISV